MKVEVLYRSHRYEEFDTSLTCPEPHRKEGVSILTDWNLYLGDLKGQVSELNHLKETVPQLEADVNQVLANLRMYLEEEGIPLSPDTYEGSDDYGDYEDGYDDDTDI